MKNIILFILILCSSYVNAQTAISPATPLQSVMALKPGPYYFMAGSDTVIFTPCTPMVVLKHDTVTLTKTVTIHDTLPRFCPPVVICPVIDTAAIQKLKICTVCPPPIVCPACPPAPKQRTAVGITWDIINNKRTVTYDDKTTSTL